MKKRLIFLLIGLIFLAIFYFGKEDLTKVASQQIISWGIIAIFAAFLVKTPKKVRQKKIQKTQPQGKDIENVPKEVEA